MFDEWIAARDDLADFEVIPVFDSADVAARLRSWTLASAGRRCLEKAGASRTKAPLITEERLDVRGELCGVLEEKAVRGVRVDLHFGVRDQAREEVGVVR